MTNLTRSCALVRLGRSWKGTDEHVYQVADVLAQLQDELILHLGHGLHSDRLCCTATKRQ